MALEKAWIQRLNEKGNASGDPVKVLFNPTEYSIEKSNQFHTVALPGKSTPVTQFISGNTDLLTMELFFDSYEEGEDVRKYTGKVTSLLQVDSELHAPPICKFIWGKLEFKAVLEKVSQRFTMFLSTGIPVRASLQVVFKEYKTITEQADSISGLLDKTKQITIKSGMTLSAIAESQYGEASKWRMIATANGISNPRKLQPGMQIKVPPLE
jgi:nucleoid-associated protein YgaU